MKKIILTKQDWALSKSLFFEKFGVSDDEYQKLIKQREEYRKERIPLPNPVGCTIQDDGNISFDIASECRKIEQTSTCPINTIRARLDSNGNSYIEFTTNSKFLRYSVGILTILSSALGIYKTILPFRKGEK